MWQNENGPNGGDEINILKPGRNYGWPVVSYGRDYPGPYHNEVPGHRVRSARRYWARDRRFRHDLLYRRQTSQVEGRRLRRLAAHRRDSRHGHVERILFNEKMQELRRESLLTELRQRVRDIRQSPDGYLYVLTDEKDGAVLRIEPAP
jgi:glucose/arabinose dehydrogenase